MADFKEIKNVKRSDLDKIRDQLQSRGITIPLGDDVEVSGPFGVRIQVTYTENDQTLRLSINEKPGFITDDQIWNVVEMGAGKLS